MKPENLGSSTGTTRAAVGWGAPGTVTVTDSRASNLAQLVVNVLVAYSCVARYNLLVDSGVDQGSPTLALVWAAGFVTMAGVNAALLARPDLFAATLTEKLLTFALGRGVEPSDGPAIRTIVRRAQTDDYRFSTLILGLVNSPPFQLRRTASP